ncbi:MAG: [protein-PII] uridylyltransferase [Actinomycetota bacterium]|jgi:[protein-PII] uridylyltransferase|nr:[protein-PII] uridylyltransferase [Actinomycetota bacterium]
MEGASLRERRHALLERTDLYGHDFCRAYAAEADAWLSDLALSAIGTDHRGLALIAVGGYGRAELCPYSDLDVVLVHEGRRNIATVADAIWYPVWDQGVRLDHSVRRPGEVLTAASSDLRVALGLLDARLIWGDPEVSGPLLARFTSTWRSQLGGRWLPELEQQVALRHHVQGDVAFLLEPDLKESHGGLRDVNVLRALALSAPLLSDYVDLSALSPAAEVLTRARVELHRHADRELDRLLLQEQDQIASALAFPDADTLMSSVAEAGRSIAWVSDEAWRRRRFWHPVAPRRFRIGARRKGPEDTGEPPSPALDDNETAHGITVVGGEVALTPTAPAAIDPTLALRLAAAAARRSLPIARPTLHRLVERMPPLPDPWPAAARQELVRALSAGRPAVEALESLDHYGLLVRILPEWQGVRNKPQRNAYHRFTVDRHLLEAAANAAALTGKVDRPDLLLVGALLHDIGKGSPGDHTVAGMAMIDRIARRMGFSAEDVTALVDMCRLHLLLPDTATRRDLDDPTTIEKVAQAVGDVATLARLAALTEADSLATGPSAWGPWKAGLVADLVQRVSRRLAAPANALPPTAAVDGWITEDLRVLMTTARRQHRPVVLFDPPRVVIAAPDRPGILASVAGLLALHGLDVRSADAAGEEGAAVELFSVESGERRWPDLSRFEEDLDAVLSGELALDERLQAKASAYAGSRRVSNAHPIEPAVMVDDDASATSTVIEIRAPDELGLLRRVTRALFDCGLDVVSARVSTVGDAVVDAFYVRDAAGRKLSELSAIEAVRQAVSDAIALESS